MKDSGLVDLKSPEEAEDALSGVLRQEAMRLLTEALEIEVESFIEEYKGLRLSRYNQKVCK